VPFPRALDDAMTPSPADPISTLHHDAVMRSSAILGLIGVGVIHFAQVVQTTEQTPYLGVAFLLLALATAAVAAMLLHGGSRLAWALTAAVNLAAIGGYVFTRLWSTALDNQDVGNWSEALGLAALFLEVLLAALALYALSGKAPNRRPDPELALALDRLLSGHDAARPSRATALNGHATVAVPASPTNHHPTTTQEDQ